ncbi:MAG: divergent polysaccharide deacetylase family protein [Pseudomonadota bacterium]|nr:divergent polysaccharide deacetylase family protein [Pseudomonadota bacterium]
MRKTGQEGSASLSGPMIALAVFLALSGAVILWLTIMAEDTRSARMTNGPRFTVAIDRPLSLPDLTDLTIPEVTPEAVPVVSDFVPVEEPEPESKSSIDLIEAVAKDVFSIAPPPGASVNYDTDAVLTPAPYQPVTETLPNGIQLPKIADDGRQPWQVYARPFATMNNAPRIAIVMSNLGLSQSTTKAAINELPPDVTLAFAPYAENLDTLFQTARTAGHEVLLSLPMEPLTYPRDDPGPKPLLTTNSDNQNIDNLAWMLSRAQGYVGVTNFMGSRFTADAARLRPILKIMKNRGLMVLDARATSHSEMIRIAKETGLPRAANNRYIDHVAKAAIIDEHLRTLEHIAAETGAAVGIGFAYPVTRERLLAWLPTLHAKGLVLAPLTAVVNRQSATR